MVARRLSDVDSQIRKKICVAGRTVVLLEPQETQKPECNLMAFDNCGMFVWEMYPPISPAANQYDGFVNIDVDKGVLYAWSWSGFQLKIDFTTGRVEEMLFTK